MWIGIRYVEENPCRAGMEQRPQDYRWSSAAAHMGVCRDRSGILDMDFWERAGGAETWKEMYSAEVLPQYTTALKKCTYSGRPFGDEAFVTEMEQRFQRKSSAVCEIRVFGWRRGKADLVGEIALTA